MKRISQVQIAGELGVSKSYLSMILKGQRRCPPDLLEKLQSIPGVHKAVNLQSCLVTFDQGVGSSSLPRPTIQVLRGGRRGAGVGSRKSALHPPTIQ